MWELINASFLMPLRRLHKTPSDLTWLCWILASIASEQALAANPISANMLPIARPMAKNSNTRRPRNRVVGLAGRHGVSRQRLANYSCHAMHRHDGQSGAYAPGRTDRDLAEEPPT